MLKHLKWQEICSALMLGAIGAILLARPELGHEIIMKTIGILLIAVGAVFVISFFLRRVPNIDNNNLVNGIVTIAVGVFVYLRYEMFVAIFPMILGIGVALSGVFKLQRGFEIRRMRSGSWAWVAVVGLINILLGALIMLNPDVIAVILMRLIGGSLVFSALFDLITTLFMSRKFSKYNVEGKAEPAAAPPEQSFVSDDLPPEQETTAPWEETEL